MAEIVNARCSPELKARTRSAVTYFINKIGDLGEWCNNYTNNYVIFTTYVYYNKDRFPLSLINQHERGVLLLQVHFATKEVIIGFFKEVVKDITSKSATAKQYYQSIQL